MKKRRAKPKTPKDLDAVRRHWLGTTVSEWHDGTFPERVDGESSIISGPSLGWYETLPSPQIAEHAPTIEQAALDVHWLLRQLERERYANEELRNEARALNEVRDVLASHGLIDE